jgi:hypothetical protein
MPARHVFFSFHYEQDIWRATNVRKVGRVDATAAAGWSDGLMLTVAAFGFSRDLIAQRGCSA